MLCVVLDSVASEQFGVGGVCGELGLYQDTRFKSEPEETKTPTLASVAVLAFKGDAADALARAPHLAAGVGLARDLVSAPPSAYLLNALFDSPALGALYLFKELAPGGDSAEREL